MKPALRTRPTDTEERPRRERTRRLAKPVRSRLALQEIRGNLTRTTTEVIAWYELAPTRWGWLTNGQREDLLYARAVKHASLAGRHIHGRRTSRPYPVKEWARQFKASHPVPPERQAVADKRLVDAQYHLASRTLAEPVTYYGLTVCPVKVLDRLERALRNGKDTTRYRREIEQHLREIDAALCDPLIGAVPCSSDDIAWLTMRSIGIGLPPVLPPVARNQPYTAADIDAFLETVEITPQPGEPCFKITASSRHPRERGDGTAATERYVAVVSLGRMEPQTIPGPHYPWLALVDSLDFPVEVSWHADIIAGKDAKASIQRKLELVVEQDEQYVRNGIPKPPAIDIALERATAIRHELEEGDPLTATRVWGTYDFAVSGHTEEETLARVQALKGLYAQQNITVEQDTLWRKHYVPQAALARAFIPGEKPAVRAHHRHLKVDLYVAGLPTLATRIGDKDGTYFATAASGRRAVMWHMHRGMENRAQAGSTPVVSGLGGGKTAIIGIACESEILDDDAYATILDPSGPFGVGMAQHPHLKGDSVHVDIVSPDSPIMSPWAVITEPKRERFSYDQHGNRIPDDKAAESYAHACDRARQQRLLLAYDTIYSLFTAQQQQHERTPDLLLDAITEVGGHWQASIFDVIKVLTRDTADPHAKALGGWLRNVGGLDLGQRMFGSGDGFQWDIDARGLFLTSPGLRLPQVGKAPSGLEQVLSVALLNLGTTMASSRIYSRERFVRKFVGLDETHFITGLDSGRALIERIARDSRKWNARAMIATQLPKDLLALDIAALFAEAFVGLIEDTQTAADALRLIRVPTGAGYEQALTRLSPVDGNGDGPNYRDWVWRDGMGNVEIIRPDFEHRPYLKAILQSDPTKAKTRALETLLDKAAA